MNTSTFLRRPIVYYQRRLPLNWKAIGLDLKLLKRALKEPPKKPLESIFGGKVVSLALDPAIGPSN